MSERLQPILALLDEGLSLYRRNFVGFALIAASWLIPVAIAAGLGVAAAEWLTTEPFWLTILILLALLALIPLLTYLVAGLSRGALAAAEGRVVRLREALAIPPLRAISMGAYMIIYSIMMQIFSSLISFICICPLYIYGIAAVGIIGSVAGESALTGLGLLLLGIFFMGVYLLVLFIGGAGYSSMVYAIQPWVQGQLHFGAALQRSIELIVYRFWRNTLVWGIAALLVAAVGLTVTVTVGMILSLPLLFALGAESPVAQAVAATAWVLGLVFVLPPLPIWMALWYQRNITAREGTDLEARIQSWWEQARQMPDEAVPTTV